MRQQTNMHGFAAVEAVLIIIVLGIIGFTGFFVYHSKQATDKTLAATGNNNVPVGKKVTNQQASSATTATAQIKYLDIKEWGVKLPYGSSDTLSYTIEGPYSAQVASVNLANQYDCNGYGSGSIGRSLGTSENPDNNLTIAQEASQNPGTYFKVGDYYYNFAHDQAGCSETVTGTAQNDANNFLKSILPNIEAD